MDGVIGYVTLFAGNFAPRAWALCQGQLLSISSNTALFSILGTTYGGDGRTTFALPDLQGRTAIGAGSGPGLSQYDLGQEGGSPVAMMLTTQLPAHIHTASMHILPGAASAANSTTPGNAVYATPSGGDLLFGSAPSGQTLPYDGTITTGPNNGSSQPFSITDPLLALNYIVCLQGVFPQRP